MHLKALILAISFVATTGFPVLQNNDYTRPEASSYYSSQMENQAADKTELTKEADRAWKSSLEGGDLYADLYTHNLSQSQGLPMGDVWRKQRLESQRLRARLAQDLRELRERLADAFAAYPMAYAQPPPPQQGPPAALDRLARRLRATLDGDARELCSALRHYSRGPETAGGGPAPEPGATPYEEAAWEMGRALGYSERELTAHLAEFRAEVYAATGGQGGSAAKLMAELDAFAAGVRGRAESLRAGLAGTRSLGEGLSRHVEHFCRSSEEENRRFVGKIERQLEEWGQGERGAPEGVPFISSSSTGSLGEDFSPKLNALLQDILQTLN